MPDEKKDVASSDALTAEELDKIAGDDLPELTYGQFDKLIKAARLGLAFAEKGGTMEGLGRHAFMFGIIGKNGSGDAVWDVRPSLGLAVNTRSNEQKLSELLKRGTNFHIEKVLVIPLKGEEHD